jgi:hypothetical protein
VTHLRKMMLEVLQRRNYSEVTTSNYLRAVADFGHASQFSIYKAATFLFIVLAVQSDVLFYDQ